MANNVDMVIIITTTTTTIIIIIIIIIAFSRNERTHPNFVSQAQEIEIFCEDCQLAVPVSFFRGFEPRFSVHLLRHACSPLWFLSWFSTL